MRTETGRTLKSHAWRRTKKPFIRILTARTEREAWQNTFIVNGYCVNSQFVGHQIVVVSRCFTSCRKLGRDKPHPFRTHLVAKDTQTFKARLLKPWKRNTPYFDRRVHYRCTKLQNVCIPSSSSEVFIVPSKRHIGNGSRWLGRFFQLLTSHFSFNHHFPRNSQSSGQSTGLAASYASPTWLQSYFLSFTKKNQPPWLKDLPNFRWSNLLYIRLRIKYRNVSVIMYVRYHTKA